MKRASVSEVKSKFSEFLRQVKGGETIMVLDRGRPVAVLAPCAAPDDDLTELVNAGLVRLGSGKLPADFWTRKRAADPGATVRAALIEDREDRF